MPTISESNAKRRSYAWMVMQIMQEKERAAEQRLKEIQANEPILKAIHLEYEKRWREQLLPLMSENQRFHDEQFEKRELEEFLQGQALRAQQQGVKVEVIASKHKSSKTEVAALTAFKRLTNSEQAKILEMLRATQKEDK